MAKATFKKTRNGLIVLVFNGKGGTGKSTASKGVIDALRRQSPTATVTVIETDTNNADVYKAIDGHERIEARAFDIRNEGGFIGMANFVESQKPEICVINAAAGLTSSIVEYTHLIDAVADELGMRKVLVFPIDRTKDSLEDLFAWVEAGHDDWETFVVRNQFFGEAHKFALLASSGLIEKTNGVIDWPELNDHVTQKMGGERQPPWISKGLTIAERSALRQYRNKVGAALQTVFGEIPPAGADE